MFLTVITIFISGSLHRPCRTYKLGACFLWHLFSVEDLTFSRNMREMYLFTIFPFCFPPIPKWKGKLLIEKLYSRYIAGKQLKISWGVLRLSQNYHCPPCLTFGTDWASGLLFFNMLFRRCHALDRGAESMCFSPLTSHSLVQHTCGTTFWSCLGPRQARRCASAGPYPTPAR